MGNLNLGTIECQECENAFSCRIGLSNRSEQELNLSCKECGALSTFNISEMQELSMIGVKESIKDPGYHIDLHLDFPVFEHDTHPLISPFIMSHMLGGEMGTSKHAHDMALLNSISNNIVDIKNSLGFYLKKKYKPFSRKVSSYLNIEEKSLDSIQAEALLFKYLFEIIEPFNSQKSTNTSIDLFIDKINEIEKASSTALKSFTNEISSSKFTEYSINDAVKIYRKLLSKEVIFRPSLFLDHVDHHEDKKLPFLLSTKDFEYVSDLFKDISEVLSRQFVIVAGINNLLKRNDHNIFEVTLSAKNKHLEPKSLKDYADLDFGRKLSFIDSPWLKISSDIADNQLRNSTAHYKWEYDPSTQLIKYYPKKEGLNRVESKEILLIDYCKKVIESFRVFHEINYLLHMVNLKSLEKI
ncbi:hypothetical protein CBQ28_04545 [Pseudoalteromonas sp. GCY]|uniref:hypothetical protein n=1 Tax=Pseudoalteromonas sp. GCY TaxID=2003316 RepID=UPI000BFEBC92|nr:hypothetical protein [Pseudoalteromonas sp. GCY]PHI38354.1 hypothetical protein CBQ28_04545 [Pseudoalteromonas sp. GCY]QQQ65669.1 hypothetical protein JJQ94_15265 [Pseudoalteromonas sp. GCY]